jgi:LuxR family maltose regulon positive regulatory protein
MQDVHDKLDTGSPPPPVPLPSGAVLAATKLQIPRARARLVPRPRLVSVLTRAARARLVLLHAPAGSGKTTLLAEWYASPSEERPFAWLTLDSADNDPVRFLEGVIAALQTVDPGTGAQALVHLAGPAALEDVVLPSLVNDIARLPRPVVLALDDYYLITSPVVHKAVTYLLDHQPDTLQVLIGTRAEPALPLGRLRVQGELVEVRGDLLRFTADEAEHLLNRTAGLGLATGDVARLQDRTEGWAAGLQLAALSLAGRDNPSAFISAFAGDDRPVADYLGVEVLDGQPPEVRDFLVGTAVLDRLSGALCDAVVAGTGSAARLDELERAGLPLVPLDEKREWYRYHHLFAGLLRHELARTKSADVPALHRRASDWYLQAGSAGEAIRHAIAAGDAAGASALIRDHWYSYLQHGRLETVAGWLDALGDDVVAWDTGLCLTKAWIAVNTGRLDQVATWIEAGERAGADEPMLESGLASLHEIHRYMSGDVVRAVEAGRFSVERGETPWRPVGCPVLGIALFWSGRSDEAVDELERSAEIARSADNHLAVIHASAGLAAIHAERGEVAQGDSVARSALRLADERGLTEHWATTMARVVHGRALEEDGRAAEAGETIDLGVELSQRGVASVEIAYARLAQAEARRWGGDPDGAEEAVGHARQVIDECPTPGILRDMLARTERRLHLARRARPRNGSAPVEELTEAELGVLRLLPGRLSQREIGSALSVSLNTVKTHARSIYRKLDVDTRDDAVTRARGLGLL